MLLIDYAREHVGLTIGSVIGNRHAGWTTDPAKAEAMRAAGAHAESVPSRDPRPDARRFDGWEITFALDSEAREPA